MLHPHRSGRRGYIQVTEQARSAAPVVPGGPPPYISSAAATQLQRAERSEANPRGATRFLRYSGDSERLR